MRTKADQIPASTSEESLTEELKIRLKPSQRRALNRAAQRLGHNESGMARFAIVSRLEQEGELKPEPTN